MDNKFKYLKRLSVYLISFCVILLTMIFSTTGVHADENQSTVTINKIRADGGTYFQGDTVSIYVYFSEPVVVSGKPYIATTVGDAIYTTGGGTNILKFDVTIPNIQSVITLNYITSNSLVVDQNSSIKSMNNIKVVNLMLPSLYGPDTLSNYNVNLLPGTPSFNGKIVRESTNEELSQGIYYLEVSLLDEYGNSNKQYTVILPANKEFKLGGFEGNKKYLLSIKYKGDTLELVPASVNITTDANGVPMTSNVLIKMYDIQIKCLTTSPYGGVYNAVIRHIEKLSGENVELLGKTFINELDGVCFIGNLEDGEYRIWASDASDSFAESRKTLIKIENGMLTEINGVAAISNVCELKLSKKGVNFVVKTPDGQSVNEVCDIWITSSDKSFGSKSNATNKSGELQWDNLNDGEYMVKVIPGIHNDLPGSMYIGQGNNAVFVIRSLSKYSVSVPQKITIKGGILAKINGVDVNDDNCNILLTNPTLTGKVIFQNGDVLNNEFYYFKVYSVDDNGKLNLESQYNSTEIKEGIFKLGGFEANRKYFISVVYDGKDLNIGPADATIITDQNGIPTTNNISLKFSNIQVRCNPIIMNGYAFNDWVNIYAEKLNGDKVDFNGKMYIPEATSTRSIYNLEDGEYRIWMGLTRGDYEESEKTLIKIENGVLSEVNGAPVTSNVCEFRLGLPYAIFEVKTPDGQSLNEESSVFLKKADGSVITMKTNNSGELKWPDLEDGDYTVYGIPNDESDYMASNSINIKIERKCIASVNGNLLPNNLCNIPLNKPAFNVQIKCIPILYNGDRYVGSINVYAEKLNGERVAFPTSISSNQAEVCAIGNLVDGEYRIWIQSSKGDYADSEKMLIKIKNGALAEVNGTPTTSKACMIKLGLPQITFVVNPFGGWGLNERCLICFKKSDNSMFGISTNNFGVLNLTNLEDGDYTVNAVPNNQSKYSVSKPRRITVKNSKIIKINGTDVTTDCYRYEMTLSNPTLTGKILSSTGDALNDKNYSLYVYSIDSNSRLNLESQYNLISIEDGNFKLGGFEANKEYFISAFYNGKDLDLGPANAKITTDANGIPTPNDIVIKLPNIQIKCVTILPSGDVCQENFIGVNIEKLKGDYVDLADKMCFNGGSKCSIYNLPDGEYRIWTSSSPLSEYESSEKTLIKIENGVLTEVNGAAATSNICNLKLRLPQVEFVVKTPDGQSLNETCDIYVTNLDHYTGPIWGSTNNLGKRNWNNLKDGNYKVIAKPMYASNYSASSVQYITIKNGKIEAVNNVAVADNVCNILLSNPTLTGKVLSPTGTTLNDVDCDVYIYSAEDNGDRKYQYSLNVPVGKDFKLGGFEADKKYIIEVVPNSNDYILSRIEITTDENGNPKEKDVIIKLGDAQIKCIVSKWNGQIVDFKKEVIDVEDLDGSPRLDFNVKYSQINGKCIIYGLKDGEYLISAQYSGKDYGSSENILVKIENGILTEVNGKPVAADTYELKLREPQLAGTVTTPQGKALNESCSIEIVDLKENSKFVLTNESGEYNVNDLEDGDYTITAVIDYSNDYAASVPKKITIKAGKLVKINESDVTDKNCDLVLSNPSLTGSIIRTTGEPLEQGDYVLQVLEVDDLGNSKMQYSVMLSVYDGFKLGGFEPNKTYEIRGLVYGDHFFEIDGIKITTDNNGNPLQDNITMEARMPIMYIEAVDESDNIIKEDVEIKIEGIDALEVEKLLNGSYEIYDLADGTYTVWIQSKNSQSSFDSSKHTIEILNGSLIKVDGVEEASNTLKIKVQTLPNTNYVLGDVDGDGKITNADAELILKYAADLVTFTDQQKLTADVNGDGKVSAGDATLIYRYVQKLIQQFPKVS